MKFRKIIAVTLLAACMCTAAAGCAGKASDATGNLPMSEPAEGKTFRPSEITMKRMDKYDYPYMGLSFTLPESLMKKMDDQDLAMLCDEQINNDETHRYAMFTWSKMTAEQKNMDISMKGDGYFDWEAGLSRVGALGMYSSDVTDKELSEITKCDKHEQIGESSDGKYKYFLSTNSAADPADLEEIKSVSASLRERTEMREPTSAFMQPSDAPAKGSVKSIAPLSAETIDGKEFTDKNFADYDLTMVNVFATWCTTCVQEIPDLQKLYSEMQSKGVNIVGVVTDTVDKADSSGKPINNDDIIALAKKIQEKTNAEYPFLKPDTTALNGRLNGIDAFPETFFVDKNGNIVGDTYSGSRSYAEWKEIVQNVLEEVKGN